MVSAYSGFFFYAISFTFLINTFSHVTFETCVLWFTNTNKDCSFKVARNSFLARTAWAADCVCLREHTRLTQVQI